MSHNVIAAPTPGASPAQVAVRTQIKNAALKRHAEGELARQAQTASRVKQSIQNTVTGGKWSFGPYTLGPLSDSPVETFNRLLAQHASTPNKHHYGDSFGHATEVIGQQANATSRSTMLQALEKQFGAHRIPAYFTRALAKII